MTKLIPSLFLVLFAALAARAADKAAIVQGTATAKAAGLHVHGGGLVLREGEPGAAFTVVKAFGGKPSLAFFVVIKHGYNSDTGSDTSEESSSDGKTGTTRQVIALDDRR